MASSTRIISPRTRAVLRKSRRKRGDDHELTAGSLGQSHASQGQGAGQAAALLQMQRLYGNRNVSRLLAQEKAVQRKGGEAEATDASAALARIEAFAKEHPDHAHLVEGFGKGMNEADIVGRLLENFFKRSDFDYDFSDREPFKHRGDCATLVREFVTLAKAIFGIPMEIKDDEGGFFISGGAKIIHKNHVTGNVDSGKHFYFETHTWAVWRGRPIDVLFGQLGVVSHLKGVKVQYGQDRMPYWDANGFIFYLKHGAADVFDRYSSNFLKRMKL
jgi:hypothetical protein